MRDRIGLEVRKHLGGAQGAVGGDGGPQRADLLCDQTQ